MVVSDPRLETAISMNDVLLDRGIRHGVFIERLKTQQAKVFMEYLISEVLPDILDRLESDLRRSGMRRPISESRRLRSMVQRIRSMTVEGIGEAGRALRTELVQIGYSEAAFQLQAIQAASPVGLGLNSVPRNLIRATLTTQPMEGKLLSQWLSGLSRTTVDQIAAEVNRGVLAGDSVQNIVRRVRGTRPLGFQDGVFATTRRNAETIVRTSVAHITNQAARLTYSENMDVIKGVRFVATLDAKTTPICGSLDGRVFKPDEAYPQPPLHMNCRSRLAPVTKSWREMGLDGDDLPRSTRASMNGQVPADLTYTQWLRSQPASIQDEILGPGRAALYRRGKLNFDKFVDNRGNPLSLQELERLEGLSGK